jgi:hypothetical protein
MQVVCQRHEDELLRPYIDLFGLESFEEDKQVHIGNVLFGLVRVCKTHVGPMWPLKVRVMDGSSTMSQVEPLMDDDDDDDCPLYLVVISSQISSHWSMLVVRRCNWDSVVLDGKMSLTSQTQASEVLRKLQRKFGEEQNSS